MEKKKRERRDGVWRDPDSGIWRYRFMHNGKRYFAAVPEAKNKTEAKAARDRRRIAVREGREEKADAETNFKAFVQETFLPWAEMNKAATTYRSYRSRCEDLIKAFGELELSEVSPFGIEKFKKEQLRRVTKRKRPQSPASVNRSLLTLGSIYTRAEQLKLITREKRPKIEMLREESKRLRYLSIDEERRLLTAAAAWGYLHDIIVVGLATGLRRNELFNLKKVDVDLSLNLVNVIDGKGGKSRSVPLDPEGEAHRVLTRLKRESRSDWIFTSHRTGRKFKHVNLSLKEAARAAEVEGVTLHTLRHTFCTRLAASGVDIRTIKDLAGHSDISTTMRYMHLVESNKHQAIRRLTNYHEFTTEKAPGLEARRA